jgi:Lon protease-like protein
VSVITLPLFPLGTVLFPGARLPLHIFERRYRTLIADILARTDGFAEFGVVAIRATASRASTRSAAPRRCSASSRSPTAASTS